MMRRLFWFAVGAGSAVYVAVKVRDLVQQATPKAIGQRVSGSVTEVSESVRGFSGRVRAAMAEREAELRAVLDEHGASPDWLDERAASFDRLGRPD